MKGVACRLIQSIGNRLRCHSQGHGAHQLRGDTSLDRYPVVFDRAASLLHDAGITNPRVLSIGCSTGEECFSITQYVSNATVFGIDTNKRSVALAKRRYGNNKILFETKQSLQDFPSDGYDLVMANAVLCRWPETRSLQYIGELYSFAKFEELLGHLTRLTRSNGLLMVAESNYRVADTHFMAALQSCGELDRDDLTVKFDPDGNRYQDQRYRHYLFRKIR